MTRDVALMRSNYFAVKDPKAFQEFCQACGLELLAHIHDGFTLYGFCRHDFIPVSWYDASTGTYVEIDFMQELSHHLDYGWVAIVLEIGSAEIGRFPIGNAWAVNAHSETRHMGLTTIFEMAVSLGEHVMDVFGFGENAAEM